MHVVSLSDSTDPVVCKSIDRDDHGDDTVVIFFQTEDAQWMSTNRHDAAMCELLKDDPYKTTVFVGALHGTIPVTHLTHSNGLSRFRNDDGLCSGAHFLQVIW